MPGHSAAVARRLPQRAADTAGVGKSRRRPAPKGKKSPAGSLPTSPAEAFICIARTTGHSARVRWARCWCRSMGTTAFRCDVRPHRQACEERPNGPGRGPSVVSLRALLGSSALMSGASREIESQRSAAASIPLGVFCARFAPNTSIWSPRCAIAACKSRPALPSTSHGRGCWRLLGAGIMQVVAPTGSRARWCAHARTGLGLRSK